MRRGPIYFLFLSLAILIAGVSSCGNKDASNGGAGSDNSDHRLPDTLKVATLYSPEAYFIYRGQEMGYDYELVTALAVDKDLALKMEIAPSLSRALEMLDSGIVDLIAYEVPITAELKDRFVPCGPENITTQVLVQPKKGGAELITDVTDLVGEGCLCRSRIQIRGPHS